MTPDRVDFNMWEMKNALKPAAWDYLNFAADRRRRCEVISDFLNAMIGIRNVNHPLGVHESDRNDGDAFVRLPDDWQERWQNFFDWQKQRNITRFVTMQELSELELIEHPLGENEVMV